MIKLKKIEDIKLESNVISVYGNTGSGKTTFCATLPRPILYIDINEKGLNGVPEKLRHDIHLAEIDNKDQLFEIMGLIKEDKLNKYYGIEFKSIVFDTMTQFETMFIDYANANPGEFLNAKGTALDKWKMLDDLNHLCRQMLRTVKAKDLNAVFLFQETKSVDNETKIETTKLAGNQAMTKVFLAETDVVGRTIILEKHDEQGKIIDSAHALVLKKTYNSDVKVRSKNLDKVPDFIVKPTWEKLHKGVN